MNQLMIDAVGIVNRALRVKGNLLKMNFEVDRRMFEAFVPDDQLFIAVKDVLLNREYEYIPEFELSNFKNKIVVDAGAHVGLFSLVASVFVKKVISIEPSPFNFRILEINKIINRVDNVVPLNNALWFKKTLVELYQGAHSAGDSIFKISRKRYVAQSVTLSELIDELGKVDLLKIDVEGSEFEIIRNIGSEIKNVNNIVMEVHIQKGNVEQIKDRLTSDGFKIAFFNPPLVKKNGQYRIELKNFVALKAVRRLIYGLSALMNKKDDTLVIAFAWRE